MMCHLFIESLPPAGEVLQLQFPMLYLIPFLPTQELVCLNCYYYLFSHILLDCLPPDLLSHCACVLFHCLTKYPLARYNQCSKACFFIISTSEISTKSVFIGSSLIQFLSQPVTKALCCYSTTVITKLIPNKIISLIYSIFHFFNNL